MQKNLPSKFNVLDILKTSLVQVLERWVRMRWEQGYSIQLIDYKAQMGIKPTHYASLNLHFNQIYHKHPIYRGVLK
jgi:hypothetical protein